MKKDTIVPYYSKNYNPYRPYSSKGKRIKITNRKAFIGNGLPVAKKIAILLISTPEMSYTPSDLYDYFLEKYSLYKIYEGLRILLRNDENYSLVPGTEKKRKCNREYHYKKVKSSEKRVA